MSGFQIFAAEAAFQNRAARDFFTHPTKKNALSFPDFCQKAWFLRLQKTKWWKNLIISPVTKPI